MLLFFPLSIQLTNFHVSVQDKKMQFRYKKFLPRKGSLFPPFLSKKQKMIRKFTLRIFPCRALEAQMMASKWVLTNWGLLKSIYNYCTYFYFNPIMHTYYLRDCLPIFRLAVDFYVQMLYLKILHLRISIIALLRIFLYQTLYVPKNGSSKYVDITHISTLFFFWNISRRCIILKKCHQICCI